MIRLAALLLMAAVTAHAHAGVERPRHALYVEARGWAFAEPVPIDAFCDDFRAPLQKGSDAYAWLNVETGVRSGAWRVGLVAQRQYVVEASRDTAVLHHLSQNDLVSPPGQRYDAQLDVNFYSAQGLRLGRSMSRLQLGELSVWLHPSIVLWRGDDFEDGSLEGIGNSNDAGELSYRATLRHAYSEDKLFSRRVRKPQGRGASLDLEADVAIGERWSLQMEASNLLGRMWWRNAPYTTGALDSDTRQVDGNGQVRFDPTLRGFEGNASHRQRLPLFAQTTLTRHFGANQAELGVTLTEIGAFPVLGGSRSGKGWRYGLTWLPTARKALQGHVAWGPLRVELGSDAQDWKKADHLQLRLGFEIALGGRAR